MNADDTLSNAEMMAIRQDARQRAGDAARPFIAPFPLHVVDSQFFNGFSEITGGAFIVRREPLTTGTIVYRQMIRDESYEDSDFQIIAFELRALATDITVISIILAPYLRNQPQLDMSATLGGAVLLIESFADRMADALTAARQVINAHQSMAPIPADPPRAPYTLNQEEVHGITEILRARRGAEESELTKWIREELMLKKRPRGDVLNRFLVKTRVDLSDPKKRKTGRDNFNRIVRRIQEREL
jgi:hypothetical protein